MATSITGNFVDIPAQKIYPATVFFSNGKIDRIEPLNDTSKPLKGYILPGFIDSHVHVESSMLVPSEFARLAVVHGTVATISDPHEIANVNGVAGVDYMIKNGQTVPFKFYFGAPSCVPATSFETAGATVDAAEVKSLLERPEVKYLSEMMNFPGVLHGDAEVLEKINAAKTVGKPVDGHAPGLRGENAKRYIDAGISTDHECFTAEEALDKLQYGMKILIREGSAAKNFEALVHLLHTHYDNMMFCSDDKHPDSLAYGHINQLCKRAVAAGVNVYKVLQAACINPIKHYHLEVGLLQPGDAADFIVVEDLIHFNVLQTYIDGLLVAENGNTQINSVLVDAINHFSCSEKTPANFEVHFQGEDCIDVIEAIDGQLITNRLCITPKVTDGKIVSDLQQDVLKMVVVNRYQDAPVAISWVKNFKLQNGALAGSVAHDSHNIIAVGVDDESLCRAVNLIIQHQGGVSCVASGTAMVLPLPIAGLMSAEDGYKVAKKYTAIDKMSKEAGSTLSAPFMTLSFMALLVIPHLKLSDKGLFNGDTFEFVNQTSS